jgi:hypothetical protein
MVVLYRLWECTDLRRGRELCVQPRVSMVLWSLTSVRAPSGCACTNSQYPDLLVPPVPPCCDLPPLTATVTVHNAAPMSYPEPLADAVAVVMLVWLGCCPGVCLWLMSMPLFMLPRAP